MADLASALLGDLRQKRKFQEQLALDAASAAPTPSWGAALARALQGGVAGLIERGDQQQAGQDFDKTYGGAVGQAPSQPTNPPQPNQLISALEPRGIRNNNPGNIEDGSFARRMPGYTGSDGRFAKFASAENGQTAIDSLLASYGGRGINTVGGVINRWAPPSDNNPTSSYAATVAKGMGIGPNDQIDLGDPAIRQKIAAGIVGFENGPKYAQAPSNPASVPAMGTTRVAPQIPPGVYQRARALSVQGNEAAAAATMQPYLTPKDQEIPLTDPAERLRAGIQATDTNPYQRNSGTGKITPVNPQPFAVNNIQQGQSKFEQDYGAGLAKEALGVVESGDKAVGDVQNVQLLRGLLNNIKTGKLTPAQSTIGAWAQSVGIDPKTFGIDSNLPATAEAATSLINKFALSNIGAQSGGIPANNFSEADRKFILQLVPNLRNRPEANELILDAKERMAQISIEKADKWAAAREAGMSYEKFNNQFRKELASRNVFSDLIAKADALKAASTAPHSQSAPSIDDLVKKYSK